jgi:hypothetical protein
VSSIAFKGIDGFERLKPHPANTADREAFYRRWGLEDCIVCGRGRNAEYTKFRQRLSIKLAQDGRGRYFIDCRSIAVDDDSFLILNDNRTYGSRFESNVDIESFSIFFRPGMAEKAFGAVLTPIKRALAEGGEGKQRSIEFVESLQPHDSIISPVLRYVHHGVISGVDDGDWYEEQMQFLLERMLAHHRRVTEQLRRLPALKTATRREILRHFTDLHGITPHAYLQRKRALAAARLLDSKTLVAGLALISRKLPGRTRTGPRSGRSSRRGC